MKELATITTADYLPKLNALIEKAELTNGDLAKAIGVSPSTISRLRNGEVTMTFEYMAGLTMAVGGSLDEIVGIRPATQEDVVFISKELVASYHSRIDDKDKSILYHRKWMNIFFTAFAIVVGFVLLVLAVDLLNGAMGYIRY